MKKRTKTLSILIGSLLCVVLLLQLSDIDAYALTESSSAMESQSIAASSESTGSSELPSPSSSTADSSSPSSYQNPLSPSADGTEKDAPDESEAMEIAPASLEQVRLLFSDIYIGDQVKTYDELLQEGLVQPETTALVLEFDLPDPTVFTGIPDLPAGMRVDVEVLGNSDRATEPYLAIGPGVTVNDILCDGQDEIIGGIVVMGTADSITIKARTIVSAKVAITGTQGSYSWVSDPDSSESPTDTITGVVVGAYDGGIIHGDIILEEYSAVYSSEVGFLGSMVGAYRNARVGNIVLGDNVSFSSGYVQNVIGANENSVVGNITFGTNIWVDYRNAQYATIGAASGHDSAQRKPSSVGVISMRQGISIYGNSYGTPDAYSNVCIGAERGSSVEQIRIEETLAWVQDINNAAQTMTINNSSKVTVGAYDGATVGTSSTSDAIVFQYVSIWDMSYYSGTVLVGADLNSTIQGNVVFNVSGLSSSFNSDAMYDCVIGSGNNSHITGTILLRAMAYSSSWANPQTLIGPCDATSSVHQIKVEKFASVRSWNYDAENYSIFGAPGAQLDKLWIDGDLMIQMPANTYAPTNNGEQGADFIADEILITNGNIIGQDLGIKWNYDPGSPTEEYMNDPDRMNKVPPWIHSNIKMSVPPKNQFGDLLKPYVILDPQETMTNQLIEVNSKPISTFSQSGDAYTYKFGNDLRRYLAYIYGVDSSLGSLRPSWVPDIYPVWWYEGMELDAPFVHFVYLSEAEIKPISFEPTNLDGKIDITGETTAATLSIPISLEYFEQQGIAPEVKITNAATGAQVGRFSLNTDNLDKYFVLENSGGAERAAGNKLVVLLDQFSEIVKDTTYTVSIETNALLAEFATTERLEVRDAVAENNQAISWQFRIPTPAPPPSSSALPPSSSQLPPSSSEAAPSSSSLPPSSSSSLPPSPSTAPPSPSTAPPSPSTAPPSSSTPPASSSRVTVSSSSLAVSSSSAASSVVSSSSTSAAVIASSHGSSSSTAAPVSSAGGDKANSLAQQRQETLEKLVEAGVPVLRLGDAQLPLTGRGSAMVWSLFNLVLAVLGIITTIVVLVRVLMKKRQQAGAGAPQSQATSKFWENPAILRILGMIAGALLLLLFIITQNMQYLMVIFDGWSWLMGVLAVAQAVLLVLAYKKDSAD